MYSVIVRVHEIVANNEFVDETAKTRHPRTGVQDDLSIVSHPWVPSLTSRCPREVLIWGEPSKLNLANLKSKLSMRIFIGRRGLWYTVLAKSKNLKSKLCEQFFISWMGVNIKLTGPDSQILPSPSIIWHHISQNKIKTIVAKMDSPILLIYTLPKNWRGKCQWNR